MLEDLEDKVNEISQKIEQKENNKEHGRKRGLENLESEFKRSNI